MQSITTGAGREYLVLFLGERDPAPRELGHSGAGKFWDDVWVLQVDSQETSAAAIKDTTWQKLGRESGGGVWSQVKFAGDGEGDAQSDNREKLGPGGRGCKFAPSHCFPVLLWLFVLWVTDSSSSGFASAPLSDLDASAVLLWGGLNGQNERQNDGWILRFG